MWKTLWRWGKEPAERSGLNNPDVNTGLGKRRIPTNQSIHAKVGPWKRFTIVVVKDDFSIKLKMFKLFLNLQNLASMFLLL